MTKIEKLEKEIKILKKVKRKLELLAYQDLHCKCYNRNWLEKNRTILDKEECLLSIIDVDNLKKYNDSYGHIAGDKYISILVSKMKLHIPKNSKQSCRIVRFGGDEFLIIYKGENKKKFMEKLNLALENTASLGFYEKKKKDTLRDSMHLADENMYKNKKEKKNKDVRCNLYYELQAVQ